MKKLLKKLTVLFKAFSNLLAEFGSAAGYAMKH